MRPADFGWLMSGVVLNSVAQLGLKTATQATGVIEGTPRGMWIASHQLATSVAFWLALTAYGLSVAVWVVGLSRLPVSQAYPVLSLGYIIAALLAWAMLGESLNVTRWAGIGLIIAGVFFVSRS